MTRYKRRLAICLTLLAALPAFAHSAAAQSAFGDNSTISTYGSAGAVVALALGPASAAHNAIGGVTSVEDLATPPGTHIVTHGSAGAVVAISVLGLVGHPVNQIGGIVIGR